eukprot:1353435-Amorphochlora_amoeboformis.AAC.1
MADSRPFARYSLDITEYAYIVTANLWHDHLTFLRIHDEVGIQMDLRWKSIAVECLRLIN